MIAFFVILFCMDTWGLLPKSQIDSETIEQAIVRLIDEHETSPTAHTGPNESLDVHRVEGILDHRAGSVLADKWTMTEFSLNEDFKNITPWSKTGDVSNSEWPTLQMYVEYGAVNKSEIYKSIQLPTPYLSKEFDNMFQVVAAYDLSSTAFHSWIGIGFDDETPTEGFGFVIQNGVLKACVVNGTTPAYSSALSLDLAAPHIYRAQLNAFTSSVDFYIDGSLVVNLPVTGASWDTDSGPRIGIRLVSSNDGFLRLADLFFARSVVPLVP